MKKLIVALILLIPLLANAQGYGMEKVWRDTLTIDGSSGGTLDTINIAIKLRGYEGYPYLLINPNAVKASSATDSLTGQWRRALGPAVSDTFAAEPWTTFYVKDAATALSDFDWGDSSWYCCPIDFDGRPAPYIQTRWVFTGTSANDSLEMVIEYYDIRR